MVQEAEPPLKIGAQSLILNQSPLPSYSSAKAGAFDMYKETGPWWYTGVSRLKVNWSPAFSSRVLVLPPVAPPTLHRRSGEDRSGHILVRVCYLF